MRVWLSVEPHLIARLKGQQVLRAQRKTTDPKKGVKLARKMSVIAWRSGFLALVAVIAVSVTCGPPSGKAGPPKISFSDTFWDFGRTPQGSQVSHIFWIRNTGGDTLRILRVKPG